MTKRSRIEIRILALFLTQFCWVGLAAAQMPPALSTQFDLTGFIQDATLDPTCAADAHCGGTITLNGHKVIVPKETIVILPANALTWQELFAQAPPPFGLLTVPPTTGLALSDLPLALTPPLTTYEAHVVGNRVIGPTLAGATSDQYIAGLIHISQQDLNSGAGFINFIDYALGEMRVGGKLVLDANGVPLNQLDPVNPGARVRINDPVGRFGRANAPFTAGVAIPNIPDGRFGVDDANPTIIAATGYPMCLPRTDPAAADDPLCPQANRPQVLVGAGTFYQTLITMPAVPVPPAVLPAGGPDPRNQAPLEVGDYIFFSGTLVTDVIGAPTVGPYPPTLAGVAGTTLTYVAAHTITNNVAIYTAPGSNPAYVMVEVSLIGTGGLTVLGAGEAVIRTRIEGMTTDPSRNIHLYGIDLTPAGVTSDRDWGTIGVDQGAPVGAVKGRWRFRPPCLPFGSIPTKPDKECVMNAAGTFLPPTRELRAVIEGLQGQNPASPTAVTAANGIFFGQYHAPIGEYIFPENIPGTPIVENNFNTIDFLAKGGYASSTGVIAGVLNPWPSNIVPAASCTPPVADAGGPYTVASGGSVLLTGSFTGSAATSIAWTGAPGTFAPSAAVLAPTFTAPAVATTTTVPLTLTVTNACGTNTATSTVTVNAAAAPTVNHIAPLTVPSGTPVSITATGIPATGLTFVWTQTAGTPVVLVPNPKTGATVSFTVTLPLGAPATTLQFQIVATNAAGVSSAPEFTSVTINPVADAVAVASVEYRTGKQRLIVNATSSLISPAVVLTLAPYATETGGTFDPAALGNVFTNNGGGLYILTLVGAPAPKCNGAGAYATPCSFTPVVVTSSLGGVSPASPVTKIRP